MSASSKERPQAAAAATSRVLEPGVWLVAILAVGCREAPQGPTPSQPTLTVRCAVIGGLADTGLWQELGQRFEAETGHKVEIAARAPKHEIAEAFVRDNCHIIAMHSSDTIINLVADGHAADPQPWARNDFLLVGPVDDPAGVHGFETAGAALRRIIESGNTLLVHASHGAMEVLGDVMSAEGLSFDPEHTLVRLDDRHRQMLMIAGEQRAYTVIGRIPYLNGKVPKRDLAIMVQGDAALRRPYLVAHTAPGRHPAAETAAAKQLVAFLRSEATQAWIAEYGRGMFDDEPLFFRVAAVTGQPE